MTDGVLVDNDVILKIAAWRLDAEMLAATTCQAGPPGMLGVARFVVRQRLGRCQLNDMHSAAAAFERLCGAMTMLEPDTDELAVAAALEEAATRAGLELDTGESQLLALLLRRDARLLLTGDKRAIRAIAALPIADVGQRLASLEQLVRLLVRREGPDTVRTSICAERLADTALALCFGCHRAKSDSAEIEEGLASYHGDLARSAGAVLIADEELSTLAA